MHAGEQEKGFCRSNTYCICTQLSLFAERNGEEDILLGELNEKMRGAKEKEEKTGEQILAGFVLEFYPLSHYPLTRSTLNLNCLPVRSLTA